MTTDKNSHSLVIDIGKTHAKLHVLDTKFNSIFSKQIKNVVITTGIYPSVDTDLLWNWLMTSIKEAASQYHIKAINITTHGATAALIDRHSPNTDGLVLPVLDYEFSGLTADTPEYESLRPAFEETYSPLLPAGLNLGRQLYWLKKTFADDFNKATDILMYPQYWAWRFTGTRTNEITSLGCHTDLWSIKDDNYSSLVDQLECHDLFPEVQPAWFNCGAISKALADTLGLPENCHFFNGLHDSNASFLRYKLTQKDAPFTVVSTGTWTILMASQVSLNNLDASKDMLANIDAMNQPIACARFMGGREFEAICERCDTEVGAEFNEADIQLLIDRNDFALPDFSDGSGPFGGCEGTIIGDKHAINGMALATLYSALMIDYQLDMLGVNGKIFIEGAFLKNPTLCAILNQLRENNEVMLSMDTTGTVQGASYLSDWDNVECSIECTASETTSLNNLASYQKQWREQSKNRT